MNMHETFQVKGTTVAIDPLATGSLLTNVGGMLVVVLVVMAACVWIVRRIRLALNISKQGAIFSVVGSHTIGQRSRVVVIEMDTKRILLGVTPAQINCLAIFDKPQDEAEPSAITGGNNFHPLLMKLIKQRNVESTK